MNGKKKRSPRPRRSQQVDPDIAAVVAVHGAGYLAMLAGIYKDELAVLGCWQRLPPPRDERERALRASQLEALSDMESLLTLTMIWKESRQMRPILPKAGVKSLFKQKMLSTNCLGSVQWEMFNERIEARTEYEKVDDGVEIEIEGNAGAEPNGEDEPVFDKSGLGPPKKNAVVMRLRRLLNAAEAWRLVTRHPLAPNHVEIRGTERLHRLLTRVYASWVGTISPPKSQISKKKPAKKRRNPPLEKAKEGGGEGS